MKGNSNYGSRDELDVQQKAQSLELFRLKEIDRHIFFWLTENEKLRNSLPSWLEYISKEYRQTKICLDVGRLLFESRQCYNQNEWL